MSNTENENGIAQVLKAAGARVQPPEELTAAIHAAVHAEWQAAVARRRTQRRFGWAIAASLVLAVAGFFASRSFFTPRGEGLNSGNHYLALDYPGGVSVRLDRSTSIVKMDEEHILLRRGAVYVDAGSKPHGGHPLQIQTPAGVVSHVGTQYEVRLLPGATRIRVREGRVELDGRMHAIVPAREQLLVAASGSTERASIPPDSEEWAWAARAAPVFAIEGRSLAEFLVWAGRELGCEVVYSTPDAQSEAVRATLSGSIAGLTPAEALNAVLPATRLRSSQAEGRILVERQ